MKLKDSDYYVEKRIEKFIINRPNNSLSNKDKFNKLTDLLISYNILPFLDMKEAKEFGKSNIKLNKAFFLYYKKEISSILDKYNLQLKNEYNPEEIYEQKDDFGHFIKFGLYHIEHYLLFSYQNWAHKTNSNYWEKVVSPNSLFNKEIYGLKAVCWIDLKGSISHLFHGKYKLYINHCVCGLGGNSIKITILLDGLEILGQNYPTKEQLNQCRAIHNDKEDNFNRGKNIFLRRMMEQNRNYNKEKKLKKDFLLDVIVPYDKIYDEGKGHELTVKFDHTDGTWKKNWLIDGIILEKFE